MGIRVDHHPRLSTCLSLIENKYREGKVEKNPKKGSEIELEILCRQAVGGLWLKTALPDYVPFA